MRGMKLVIKQERNAHVHSPESASWPLTASAITESTGAGKLANIPTNRLQSRVGANGLQQ